MKLHTEPVYNYILVESTSFDVVNADRKEDCARKYGEVEGKKKVMGMCDNHIVTDYIYQLT